MNEDSFTNLRRQAEVRRTQRPSDKPLNIDALSLNDARRLVEELQIYQVELEIQNDELRESQHALEIARDRFSDLYNNAPVGYVTINRRGMVVEANQKASSMLHERLERLIKRPFALSIAQPDLDIFSAFIRALFEAGVTEKSADCELRLRYPDETLHYIALTGTVVQPEGETVLFCRLALTDIEQRKQLEHIRRLLAAAVESSSEGIAICDMHERGFPLVYLSPQIEALTGQAAQVLLNQPWQALYQHSAEAFPLQAMTSALEQGRRIDIRLQHQQNQWYDVNLYPILDEKQRVRYFVHVLQDVSERVQAEAAVQQARHLDVVGSLATGLAKEFSQLVSTVISQISVAQMMTANASVESPLQQALQAAQQAADLSRQLQAYAGKSNSTIRQLDLNDVVRDTIALLRSTQPKQISLTLHAQADTLPLEADRGQIQQIALNLILNALDAVNNTGQIEVHTTTVDKSADVDYWLHQTTLPTRCACLQIIDTGRGVSADIFPRLADPFFSTKGPGHGLGLAAVLGAVRANHGAIGIASRPGRTIFTVLLPLTNTL